MLQELGSERYGAALREHCELLRAAFTRHEGYEVNYEGDSFVVAFSSAQQAVAAAEVAQHMLAAHRWPEDRVFRVRIGIHTGEPLLAPPKYVGLDVHRAARIAASAHGGQIVVSSATANALPEAVFSLRDLGEHRFKDLSAPERIYQVGDGEFPALSSLYRTNLPVAITPFIGREHELAELVALLRDEHDRILTLVGPGGTGKTRLAAHAAAEAAPIFADGVWWVSLASVADPRLALKAVAQTFDVTESTDADLLDSLSVAIARKRALLVLDNAEHLLPGLAQLLARVVRGTESARFMVTSRERLQIAGERIYAVPPLTADDGTKLFLARASAAGAKLIASPTVETLCARLDQLPLALELAAARTTVLSPEQLLDRLSQRLDLLRGGRDADPRQQTLRATITWSYELLADQEKRLFERLGVFVGGCTLEAAEHVCDAELDDLASLLDKSLVRKQDDRFEMLETIRDFARERLAKSVDARTTYHVHAEWFMALAEHAAELLGGPEQGQWLTRLEAEHDNLRAALAWAFDADNPELALRLSGALHPFWYRHGHISEGRGWLEHAVAVSAGQETQLRARVLEGASAYAGVQNDWRRARELAEESLALSQALGDRRGTAIALRDVGAAAVRAGDYETARRSYEESAALFDELGERRLFSTAIANLGDLAFREGAFERAAELTGETLALQRELGALFGASISLITLGFIGLADGNDDAAFVALQEGMLLAHELGSTDNLGYAFEGLGGVAAAREDWRRAAQLLGRARAIREATATELETAEEAVHQHTLEVLRTAPTSAKVQEYTAAGALLSDEEAIGLALAI